MNRVIKFRAKCQFPDEWVYGSLMSWKDGSNNIYIYQEDTGYWIMIRHVIPDTIGQFTGLFDKNGEEIYEGDIVNIHDSHETCGVIEYRNNTAAFVLCRDKVKNRHKGDGTDYQLYAGRQKRYEVIGNVCDNPELLKGGEK